MLYLFSKRADVAESADATDLKSVGKKFPYRFKSGHRHQPVRAKIRSESFIYRGVEQLGSSLGSESKMIKYHFWRVKPPKARSKSS